MLKRNITDEADARLAFYLPPDEPPPPGAEAPPRPQLPDGVVDAPLVRVFNFLRKYTVCQPRPGIELALEMMSLAYQLEILWLQVSYDKCSDAQPANVAQAERMRSLGWAEYLTVEMTKNRQSMVVHYWVRKPPQRRRAPSQQRPLPLLGGKLTISIVQVKEQTGRNAMRSPRARVLAELQSRPKLQASRPSDEVEHMRFDIKWEPEPGALGVTPALEDIHMPPGELQIVRGLVVTIVRR